MVLIKQMTYLIRPDLTPTIAWISIQTCWCTLQFVASANVQPARVTLPFPKPSVMRIFALTQGFPHSSAGKESACSAGDSFDSWVRKICWRSNRLPTPIFLNLPCNSAGKEPACNAGDLGLIPGLGRSPGERTSYPLQYSGLENFMDCIAHEVSKSRTRLSLSQAHKKSQKISLICC